MSQLTPDAANRDPWTQYYWKAAIAAIKNARQLRDVYQSIIDHGGKIYARDGGAMEIRLWVRQAQEYRDKAKRFSRALKGITP